MRNDASGTIYLMLSSSIFMLTGYIISIWLGKELGPAGYGIYGVVISLMTAINVVQTSGLPQATTRFIAAGKADGEAVLKASLLLQVVSTAFLTILLFALARPLSLALNDASLAPYIRATSLILPFYAVFALYVSYYNGRHDFKKQAVLNMIYSFAKLAAVVGLVYAFQLYGAIAGFVISPIVALLFAFRLPKAAKVPQGLYRSLIILSLPLTGYAILSTLQLSIDLLFVKALSGAEAAWPGLYTAGQNIARIPYYALSAFAVTLFPIVTRSIHTEEPGETGRRIRAILRNLLLLLVPSTLMIALTSPQLLELLYSSEYVAAAPSLSLLVVGLACLTILNALTYVLVGADRPIAAMALSGAGVALTGSACFLLIPHYGLLGASIGTTIGALSTTAIAFLLLYRQFPFIIPWASASKILVASMAAYLVYALVGDSFRAGYPLLLLYLALSAAYGLTLLFMREITKRDLDALKKIIPHG